MADLRKGQNWGGVASERQCPAVLWIKKTGLGHRLVPFILPRLSHHWIFNFLTQGGRTRVRRQVGRGVPRWSRRQTPCCPLGFPGLPVDRGSTKGYWSTGSRSLLPARMKRRTKTGSPCRLVPYADAMSHTALVGFVQRVSGPPDNLPGK